MADPLASVDNMIAQRQAVGQLQRAIFTDTPSSPTQGSITSGYYTGYRYQKTFTVPSFGGTTSNAYMTYCKVMTQTNGTSNFGVADEYLLGTLTVSGNSFSSGVSMPTKTINGSSVTTATDWPLVHIATTLTATTPTLTITYTNQAGTTGHTATLTLPTNAAINSIYQIMPHLQSGDTGIRAVTGVSISTGTAGSIRIVGAQMLHSEAWSTNSTTVGNAETSPNTNLPVSNMMWPIAAGDTIVFFGMMSGVTFNAIVVFNLVGDS